MPALRLHLWYEVSRPSLINQVRRHIAGIFAKRDRSTTALDLDSLPMDRLRDLGFEDGRGPSLRRAERV